MLNRPWLDPEAAEGGSQVAASEPPPVEAPVEPAPSAESANAAAPPVSDAPAPAPVAPIVDDPEFDFGPRGKFKRSETERFLNEAVNIRQQRDSWIQEQTKREQEWKAKDALYSKIGPVEELAKFIDDLGPMGPAYFQQVVEKMQAVKQDPAAALAIQTQELNKKFAQLEEWKANEIKSRETWFAQQETNRIRDAVKAEYGSYPTSDALADLAAMKKALPNKDERFIMRAYYGAPVVPGTSARTGPPTAGAAPRSKTVGEMSEAEENAYLISKMRSGGAI